MSVLPSRHFLRPQQQLDTYEVYDAAGPNLGMEKIRAIYKAFAVLHATTLSRHSRPATPGIRAAIVLPAPRQQLYTHEGAEQLDCGPPHTQRKTMLY